MQVVVVVPVPDLVDVLELPVTFPVVAEVYVVAGHAFVVVVGVVADASETDFEHGEYVEAAAAFVAVVVEIDAVEPSDELEDVLVSPGDVAAFAFADSAEDDVVGELAVADAVGPASVVPAEDGVAEHDVAADVDQDAVESVASGAEADAAAFADSFEDAAAAESCAVVAVDAEDELVDVEDAIVLVPGIAAVVAALVHVVAASSAVVAHAEDVVHNPA